MSIVLSTAPAPLSAALAPLTSLIGSDCAGQQSLAAGTAIVYCEGKFGRIDGKTANGLVRHSEKYRILAVIDSTRAGLDAGSVLDDRAIGIPICTQLDDAISQVGGIPDYFIFGKAPASGRLLPQEREIVLTAISLGMNIVVGLHEFLNDDPEFASASANPDEH